MSTGPELGPIGSAGAPEEHLQEWTRLQVRAGLLAPADLLSEVAGAIEAELPDLGAQHAAILARAWIGGAEAEHRRVAAGWTPPTDHDRLRSAWAECGEHGVMVLEGVERAAQATDAARAATEPLRGLVWFDRESVWTAIRSGVLDVHLWRADASPAVEGEWLASAVLGCLDKHGLRARWHEDHLQVATRWQRRS